MHGSEFYEVGEQLERASRPLMAAAVCEFDGACKVVKVVAD